MQFVFCREKLNYVLVLFLAVCMHVQGLGQIIHPTPDSSLNLLLNRLQREQDPVLQIGLYAQLVEHFKYKDLSKSKEFLKKGAQLATKYGSRSDIFYFKEREAGLEELSENHIRALQLYREILKLRGIKKDSIILRIHYGMGIAYKNIEAYPQAMKQYELVRSLSEEFGAPRMGILVLGLISQEYHRQGKLELALSLKREANQQTIPLNMPNILAYIYKDLGYLFLDMQQVDSAKIYAEKCIQMSNVTYPLIAIEGYILLSTIFKQTGNYAQAIDYAEKAKSQALLVHSSSSLLKSNLLLADIQLALSDYDLALLNAYQATETLPTVDDLELEKRCYLMLEELYRKKNDYQQAHQYLSRVLRVDEILNQKREELQFRTSEYLTEETANLVEQAEKEQASEILDKSNMIGIAMVVFLLAVAIIAYAISRNILFNHPSFSPYQSQTGLDLKIKFVKQLSLILTILNIPLAIHFVLWGPWEGLLMSIIGLTFLSTCYFIAAQNTLRFIFWSSSLFFYAIATLIPLLISPLIAILIEYLAIYLVINYLAATKKEYTANLIMFFISIGLYGIIMDQNYSSAIENPIELELGIGLISVMSVLVARYFTNVHTTVIKNELLQSQQFLEDISDLHPFFILTKDKHLRTTYANRAVLEALGRKKEDLIGKDIQHFLNKGDRILGQKEDDLQVLEEGKTILSQSQISGSQFIDLIKKPIHRANGEITGILTIAMDVTEKEKAKQQLEQRGILLGKIIDSLPDPIFVMAKDRSWMVYNEAWQSYFRSLFGITDMPNRDWKHDVPDMLLNKYRSWMGMVFEGKRFSESFELEGQDDTISVDMRMIPLYDSETHITGGMIIGRDVTEKNFQRKIIEQQIVDLNNKNEELQKYIHSNLHLEQFAYLASHDLKAPLRTIISFTQLLHKRLEDRLEDDETEFMEFVVGASNNMLNLINDILSFSRVNTTKIQIKKVNMNILTQEVVDELDMLVKEKDAIIELGPMPESIQADTTKIRQLLQNLLTNALKFVHEERQPIIRLSAEKGVEHWRFEVQDNGIGIKPSYQKKIFLLFQRLNNSSKYEGTGIGLATCKKIIEQHQGTIGVESEAGKGSTFYFTIPFQVKPQAMILDENI
ncbi:MAG: ATP-binding protein [Bacteroidota bacterium]